MAEFIAEFNTLAANQAVTFEKEQRCGNIRHHAGSGTFILKGGTCCNPAKYIVAVHIVATSGGAGAVQFVLSQDGEALPETTMGVVAAAANNVLSMDTTKQINVDCECSRVSLRTVTAAPASRVIVDIHRIA